MAVNAAYLDSRMQCVVFFPVQQRHRHSADWPLRAARLPWLSVDVFRLDGCIPFDQVFPKLFSVS